MWREACIAVVGAVIFACCYGGVIVLLLATDIFPPTATRSGFGHLWLHDTTIKLRLALPNTTTTTTTHPKAAEFCMTTITTTRASKISEVAVIVKTPELAKYVFSDIVWFKQWAQRVGWKHENRLPRVLLFTWTVETTWLMHVNEVHWKACYAHAHRFDTLFTASRHFDSLHWEWNGSHLERSEEYVKIWAWIDSVREYVLSGKYDYIFMTSDDTAIQESQLDFPVWAWDRGHDITIMDQYHFRPPDAYGYDANAILFKATNFTADFLQELFEYRKDHHLMNDQGSFMELLLRILGREAQAAGRRNYNGECLNVLKLDKPYKTLLRLEPIQIGQRLEKMSVCFFKWLDTLLGRYGSRTSERIGFSPTWMQAERKTFLPEAYSKPSVLGPWANCWRNVRKWWANPLKNCFAFRWNSPDFPMIPSEYSHKWSLIYGQCPDQTFNWHNSIYHPSFIKKSVLWKKDEFEWDMRLILGLMESARNSPMLLHQPDHFFMVGDMFRFTNWTHRHKHGEMLPRVLIYTTCTLDTYTKFVNELYWKACYAHGHRFSLVCASTDTADLTSVLDFHSSNNSFFQHLNQGVHHMHSHFVQEHSEANVWPWVDTIQKYLFSGEYDYVFMMSEDSLILESNLQFPVWAWDALDLGHDIILMDQHHFDNEAYGLNQNGILFKPTEISRTFLEALREYREGFYLQGSNGPFMETLLTFLGQDAEAEGRDGYNRICSKHLKLEEPSTNAMWSDPYSWERRNELYSKCFYEELERLVGMFGARKSKRIGFVQTFAKTVDGEIALPAQAPDLVPPWSNCWSGVRTLWSTPERNCFAFRWNRPPYPDVFGQVQGKCPDPTFDWKGSPLNPVNQGFSFSSVGVPSVTV